MALGLAHFGIFGGGGVSVREIAHLASRSGEAWMILGTPFYHAGFGKGGTGFQPVTCDSHSQDGCATLVDGTRRSQRPPFGDFQRRGSSQPMLTEPHSGQKNWIEKRLKMFVKQDGQDDRNFTDRRERLLSHQNRDDSHPEASSSSGSGAGERGQTRLALAWTPDSPAHNRKPKFQPACLGSLRSLRLFPGPGWERGRETAEDRRGVLR